MRAKATVHPLPTASARSSGRSPARPSARPSGRAAAERHLAHAREVLHLEAKAIASLSPRLGASFAEAIERVLGCEGHVVVTGIGKPGYLAQKLSAILASTGTPSFYLHPAEAVHGDLGRVTAGDVVLALSNSGNTEELLRILPPLKRMGAFIVALTGNPESPLAKGSDLVIDMGRIDEACPMGLVPTASSAALHALCDALAVSVMRERSFGSEDYAALHPGGSLGRQIMKVAEVMRQGEACPVVRQDAPLSKAVAVMTNTPGRPGATSVVDRKGKLVGVFTDGDLRRLIERGHQDFQAPISSVMGRSPRTCSPDERVQDAAAQMRQARIDQLPVVDASGRPVGLLDVQDLLAARFL